MKCDFDEGWYRGKCCKREAKGKFCPEHSKERCGVCGEPANRWCDNADGSFACGMPLCENHFHSYGSGRHG